MFERLFSTNRKYKLIEKNRINVKFVCKFCNEEFENKNLATLHIIMDHKDKPEVRKLADQLDKILKTAPKT